MKAPRDDSASLSMVTILFSTHVFQWRYSLPHSDSPENVRIGPVSFVELELDVAIYDVPGPPRGSFERRLSLEANHQREPGAPGSATNCGGTTLHLKVQMGSFLARMAQRSLRTDKCHVNPKLDKWHASTYIYIYIYLYYIYIYLYYIYIYLYYIYNMWIYLDHSDICH